MSRVSEDMSLLEKARCPRCGYDLRGVIESWDETCPIEGRCAECGLAFEWGELLCERRAVPRWCVEYARGLGMAPAAIKTALLMFFRPRKFWRDLKMVHAPRWGRFVALLVLMAVVLYVALAVSVGKRVYDEYRSLQNRSVTMPHHPVLYGLHAGVYPFSGHTISYVWTRRGFTRRQQTTAPREYAGRLNVALIWREARGAIRGNRFIPTFGRPRMAVVIVQAFMIAVLCPLAFVTLPESLRKAKVRWLHLLRIAAYSLMILIVPLWLYVYNQVQTRANYWRLTAEVIPAAHIFVLGGLVIWWSLACRHYLKLPHAWGVGVAVVVLAYAFGLFVVTSVDYLVI